MANAMAQVLDTTDGKVQFLWKMRKHGEYSDDFLEPLRPHLESGRIRIVDWLKADPPALLESGAIAVSVHHGGSNCYHEALLYVDPPPHKEI